MDVKLTMDELKYVQEETKLKGKRISVAYILAILLGVLGIHLSYLEKTKLAIVRGLLTIILITVPFPIRALVETAQTQGVTMAIQQYSSATFVLYVLVALASLSWFIYDLVNLPAMVNKVNRKIEARAAVKVREARNVEGQLRDEAISNFIIDEIYSRITTAVERQIKENSDFIDKDLSSMKAQLMSKREETIDLIENVNLNFNKLNELSSLLNDEIKDVEKKSFEKLEKLSADLVDNNKVKNKHSSNTDMIEDFERKLAGTIIDKDEVVSNDKFEDNNVEEQEANLAEKETISEEKVDEVFSEGEVVAKPVIAQSVNDEEDKESQEDAELTEQAVVNLKQNTIETGQALSLKKGKIAVKGYIVGQMSPSTQNVEFSNFDGNTNLAIASNPKEKDRKKMIIVQLSVESKLREKFGLLSNPEILNQEIVVNGRLGSYFNGQGLKKVSSIELVKQ